ncbi:MAG: hypothetical protein IJL74_04615 [Bacilli bacterium]|nr:hypothetical protein [Bacilli bacterium]
MKEFIKWLGVNEKVAKVVVCLMIIMIMLILTNTMLESIGLPYYAITYDNLQKININVAANYITGYLVAFLNFYSIVLLVFPVKDSKKIFKYSVLYIIINAIISSFLPTIVMHIFIIVWIVGFCYFYSGKNNKYILFAIGSFIVNTIVQGIDYFYKIRFIDYSKLNYATRSILSLDYFIIMAVIILVKEIYMKKKGVKKWEDTEYQHAGSGLVNSNKKTNLQKSLQKKSQKQSNNKKKK